MPRIAAGFLLLVAAACNSSNATAPTRASGAGGASVLVSERLEAGALELAASVRERPTERISALASFNREVLIEDAIAHAASIGLEITGFRHGSRTHAGGYTLAPGESIEAALIAYRRDLALFPSRRAERMRMLAAKEGHPELARTMREQAAELAARGDALSASGRVQVTGLEVTGSAFLIDEFRRNAPFVRGVEVQKGSRRAAAIDPAAY